MSTTNNAPRFGITKSRAGHYTVWCRSASRTCNKISSSTRAHDALVAAKKAVGDATGIEAGRIFNEWVDAHGSEY